MKKELSGVHNVDPRIKGLIKTHKEGLPLRPIIDGVSGPVYYLEKFFRISLDKFREANRYFNIKNGIEVKQKCAEIGEIDEEMALVSSDVVSLFTNTPIGVVMEILKENWDKIVQGTCIKSRAVYMEGLGLCLNNGYFSFKGEYYRQLYGVPMRGCPSVAISEIFLDYILDKAIETTGIIPPMIYWPSYIGMM